MLPDAKTRQAEALERLIKLAETTNKPDEVQSWREEKARITAPAGPAAAAAAAAPDRAAGGRP